MPCIVMSFPPLPSPALSCPGLPCPVLPFPALSCLNPLLTYTCATSLLHALPWCACSVIPFSALPFHTLPCHALPCPIMPHVPIHAPIHHNSPSHPIPYSHTPCMPNYLTLYMYITLKDSCRKLICISWQFDSNFFSNLTVWQLKNQCWYIIYLFTKVIWYLWPFSASIVESPASCMWNI